MPSTVFFHIMVLIVNPPPDVHWATSLLGHPPGFPWDQQSHVNPIIYVGRRSATASSAPLTSTFESAPAVVAIDVPGRSWWRGQWLLRWVGSSSRSWVLGGERVVRHSVQPSPGFARRKENMATMTLSKQMLEAHPGPGSSLSHLLAAASTSAALSA